MKTLTLKTTLTASEFSRIRELIIEKQDACSESGRGNSLKYWDDVYTKFSQLTDDAWRKECLNIAK
jgi:hypothetical protein